MRNRHRIVTPMVVTLWTCLGIAHAARANIESFLGTWVNAQPHTGAIARLEIRRTGAKSMTLHLFGRCHPIPCDLGTVPLRLHAQGLAESAAPSVTATYRDNGTQTLLILSWSDSQQLRLQSYQQFTEASSRPDSMSVNYFQRLSQPPRPSPLLPLPPMQTLW